MFGLDAGQIGRYRVSKGETVESAPGYGWPLGEKSPYQASLYEGALGLHMALGRAKDATDGSPDKKTIAVVRLDGQDGSIGHRFDEDDDYEIPDQECKDDPITCQYWSEYGMWTDSQGRQSRWKIVESESRLLQDINWKLLMKYAVCGFRGRLMSPPETVSYTTSPSPRDQRGSRMPSSA